MAYIVTLLFFLAWSIWAVRKGRFSWHAVVAVYVVTLFVVDYGDVPFDHWFNCYDLPVHLLSKPYDDYLAIVLSDGLIFPCIAIVFCYYSVRWHRPWLLSLLFAAMLGIIEAGFVASGYMVYHRWNHWLTPAITFISFRLLAHFAARFVYYTPPVSYRLCLLSFIYVISEWPGALFAGVMRFYQYRPHIFGDELADDRFVGMILATVMGGLGAWFAPGLARRYKLAFFLSLGVLSLVFTYVMFESGLLKYRQWSHLWTVVRYLTPYLLVYWYDRWESGYRGSIAPRQR